MLVSLGYNLIGRSLFFFGFVAHIEIAYFLFSLTSIGCAPFAAIPPAICNCFRSATKNETHNEDLNFHRF